MDQAKMEEMWNMYGTKYTDNEEKAWVKETEGEKASLVVEEDEPDKSKKIEYWCTEDTFESEPEVSEEAFQAMYEKMWGAGSKHSADDSNEATEQAPAAKKSTIDKK